MIEDTYRQECDFILSMLRYMVTEIGRDFGDINRYNMCKVRALLLLRFLHVCI